MQKISGVSAVTANKPLHHVQKFPLCRSNRPSLHRDFDGSGNIACFGILCGNIRQFFLQFCAVNGGSGCGCNIGKLHILIFKGFHPVLFHCRHKLNPHFLFLILNLLLAARVTGKFTTPSC